MYKFGNKEFATYEEYIAEFEAELYSFTYCILGAETEAHMLSVWRANTDIRAALHRAIYERKPREEPYDDMMRRLGRCAL